MLNTLRVVDLIYFLLFRSNITNIANRNFQNHENSLWQVVDYLNDKLFVKLIINFSVLSFVQKYVKEYMFLLLIIDKKERVS